MRSAIVLTVSVVIFLVATSSQAFEMCLVPFMSGNLGDCSASSVAEIYFSDSIDIPACRLFGDLNFNSTNLTNSWPNITDTCIQQSPDEIVILYRTTPSGPRRPLTVAQCQTYEQTMQCRMDCLLTFDLLVPNMKRFGYIYLRAISYNETLFTTSIGTIFDNRNNIQPTFTPRQSVNITPTMPASSSTIPSSSPSLHPSPTTTAAVTRVTQQPTQSSSSATPSITPSPSPSPPSLSSSTQPQTTPTATPMNTQCTEKVDAALCHQNNQECMNSQFSTALTAAACSGDALMLTARDSSVDSVLECLSTTAAHQLFDHETCTAKPKLRNVTCDCGGCLSGVSPSVCSASTCILWFESSNGSSSDFIIIKNITSGKNGHDFLAGLGTCNAGYTLPSEIVPSCCPAAESFGLTQYIAIATIGAGVMTALLVILLCVCCCCCVRIRNRRAKAVITGDKRQTVAAANPSFGPTSPCNTLELGMMPPSSSSHQPMMHQGVTVVIDKWKKVIKRVLSVQDITVLKPIGEGAFGQVHQGQLVRRGSPVPQQVAIKTLKNAFSPDQVDDFISESAIMLDFDHPNVLQLLGVCFDTADHLPLIVLPYMANGDLRSFLKNKRQQSSNSSMPEGISINILLDMCLDIATGMEYLANNKFVHRDLAARNCMVNEALEVKVADFGLSRDMYTKNYYRMESRKKLPIKWMAPECLNDNMYDEVTDVWSFGVTCWEIFTLGHTPYPSVDNSDILEFIVERGRRLTKPSLSPKEIWVLMQQCWMLESSSRPKFTSLKESIHQICNHYRYQTVTRSTSSPHPVSPGHYAQPYLFPDQLQESSEGESSDSSSSPSAAKIAAISISEGAGRRLSSISTSSGEYNHLGNQDSSGSSGVHFMSSMEESATDTSFNAGDSKISHGGILVTPERNDYTNVVILDPTTKPSYDDRGQSLADTGRHSITMPAPHHYFMLDPEAVRAQRTYNTGTL